MVQDNFTNMPPAIVPRVTWDAVAPADVLTALGTLGELPQSGRLITFKGDGVDTQLAWAFSELEKAERVAPSTEQRMHLTHAVGSAKRAVDCLFDAYLERDHLDVHLSPRAPFSAKLTLLKERFRQHLPWRLIPVIVANPRDTAEHERAAPTVVDAGVAVEAAQAIVRAMRAVSDPLRGPALAGALSVSSWSVGDLYEVRVHRLPGHFAWIWRCADGVARAGVGTASGVDTAEVVYAGLRDFTVDQHLRLLETLDRFPFSDWSSEWVVRKKLGLAGLDDPH